MSAASNIEKLIAEGEQRRDQGMALASRGKLWNRYQSQLLLLRAQLDSPDGTATSDQATANPWEAFPDGGPWRGPAFRELAVDGLIECVGHERSIRPSRHRCTVRRWRLVDREAALARVETLERRLAELDRQEMDAGENATEEAATSPIADCHPTERNGA